MFDRRLAVDFCGISFQNPVLLAAGTAAYGEELDDVVRLDRLGGIITKAVSLEARHGAPAPRVAEFDGGMMNAVGLANPGVAVVREKHLPWLGARLEHARVIVNVIGFQTDEFPRVIEQLGEDTPVHAFELNVSCPNTKAGGTEFGADPVALREVVAGARRVTRKPLIVKLAPTLADIAGAARTAVDSGADAISVVNTIPGLAIDIDRRRPVLGFGTGGISGPGLLPVGVLATWKVRNAVPVPIIGIGGVGSADAVLQYTIAGASLVAIGTGALRDPRLPERVVRDVAAWCAAHNVAALSDLRGTLEWPR
ncbi:MAG TPA: dihydroorotate dehydrogenase [Gemmatimonadaceae bacterium]|nr:dihydroorotate dehydrogenase [Gemmatimonadaceae bacterium]